MIEFICVSNRPVVNESLAPSIALAVGDLDSWKLNTVDPAKFDLFTGYNHVARGCSGDILAFVHDDVRFLGNPLTLGPALQALKEDQRIGFIGVAGTKLVERHGCWWGYNLSQEVLDNCRGMMFHQSQGDLSTQVLTWPQSEAIFEPVVVLDGMLLMCHRRTFEQLNGFDDQNYKGNHFYDIDITFRAAVARLVNHTAPLPLARSAPARVDDQWETSRAIFLRKFGHMLPMRIVPPSDAPQED